MASEPDDAVAAELAGLKRRIRATIHWRDKLAFELAKVDAELAADARTFRTLNGDLVAPTLPQLRRMLFDERSDHG